ncbi:MAG: hypothetical protein JXA11_05840 [Phycisphaerae bacterium]|nr:hypothetical protein [Phycisphaerae bacterium]
MSTIRKVVSIFALLVFIVSSAFSAEEEKFPAQTILVGPDAPEIRFFDVGHVGRACTGINKHGAEQKIISLADVGDAVEFHLATIHKGLYLIAVHCRTGHQHSGWEYCIPEVSYQVTADGRDVPMIRGAAEPKMLHKGTGWYDFSGWVVSRNFVELKPGTRLRITSGGNYAYILNVALLTPAQAMETGWLVPDATAQYVENARRTREQLSKAVDQMKSSGESKADFSSLLQAYDASLDAYGKKVDRWREQYQKAQASGNLQKIAVLQKQAAGFRSESENSLLWIQKQAESCCRAIARDMKDLPQVPSTSDYHARWAKILRTWMDSYTIDLDAPIANDSSLQVARKLGRAVRLLDLRNRYLDEVHAARAEPSRPKITPAGTKESYRQTPASICLNGLWEFQPGNHPADPPKEWTTLRVPHGPWRRTYGSFFNAGKEWNENHHVGWFRTRFYVPLDWKPSGTAVRFEAVFHYAEVFLNGVYLGNHLGGFERFNIPLEKAIQPGKMNEMLVMVKDTFDSKTDMTRNVRDDYSANYLAVNDLWGYNYGGIWQDVYLEYDPGDVRISDVAIQTRTKGVKRLNLIVQAKNVSANSQTPQVRCRVLESDGRVVETLEGKPETIESGKQQTWPLAKNMPQAKLWGIGGDYGQPHLYYLKTELLLHDKVVDERVDPFGFCQLWIKGNKFMLNGKELFLAAGGVWYLQEDKYPFANRFFAAHFFRQDRKANVNLERIHRHGDMTREYYEEASRTGMLLEQETNNTSFRCAPWDILGRDDFQDPVWKPNILDYYRKWAAKHRNYPCIGLTSIENETFSYRYDEELMNLGLEVAKAVQQVDPLRLYDFHGNHRMTDHEGVLFANYHYAGGKAVPSLVEKAKGRPVINGEHAPGGKPLANNRDRLVAKKGEEDVADFWRTTIQDYLKYDAAGLFVFTTTFQAYCTTSDWRKTTPWGEAFQDLSGFSEGDDRWACNFSKTVDVTWPSLSGPDAKAETMLVAASRGTFNWFDPRRKICTPNKIHQALRESFPPMPEGNTNRCQEALITVTENQKPLEHAVVLLSPQNAQPILPLGASTDSNGTGWIVPRLPGTYTVTVYAPDGRKKESQITLGDYPLRRAGYEPGLVRLNVDFEESAIQ